MRRLKGPISLLITAAIVVLILRGVVGFLVFTPRLSSPSVEVVARAYFEAQVWGLSSVWGPTLSPEVQADLKAATGSDPLLNDVFLASDLKLDGPNAITLNRAYNEEVQFTVSYTSRWKEDTGAPAGERFRFVYFGRNKGGYWQVIGQGTGP
jgi:hypothetical protein